VKARQAVESNYIAKIPEKDEELNICVEKPVKELKHLWKPIDNNILENFLFGVEIKILN